MAKWKTILQISKLPCYKQAFSLMDGTRVAIGDAYVAMWGPSEEERTLDKDDNEADPPGMEVLGNATRMIQRYSPPIEDMVKVNSRFFRTAFSALEATKGSDSVYMQLNDKYICLAFEQDGEWHRAVVACQEN